MRHQSKYLFKAINYLYISRQEQLLSERANGEPVIVGGDGRLVYTAVVKCVIYIGLEFSYRRSVYFFTKNSLAEQCNIIHHTTVAYAAPGAVYFLYTELPDHW